MEREREVLTKYVDDGVRQPQILGGEGKESQEAGISVLAA